MKEATIELKREKGIGLIIDIMKPSRSRLKLPQVAKRLIKI